MLIDFLTTFIIRLSYFTSKCFIYVFQPSKECMVLIFSLRESFTLCFTLESVNIYYIYLFKLFIHVLDILLLIFFCILIHLSVRYKSLLFSFSTGKRVLDISLGDSWF